MYSISRLAAIATLILTSACSTVIEGRTQNISVDTFPIGAHCTIKDNDIVLARVQSPGIATIEKSKNDILVECSKQGYITNKKRNRADMAITSLGNMAFGKLSFVGDMVDTASGAAHKYDSKVFIPLTALPSVAQIDAEPSQPAVGMALAQTTTNNLKIPTHNAQFVQDLAQSLSAQKVIVTTQSAEEVIQQLISGQPIEGMVVESQRATGQLLGVL